MPGLRRMPVALLAAIALLVSAGCGGGGDDEAAVRRDNAYVEQLNAAQNDFARAVEQLSKGEPGRRTLIAYAAAIDRTVQRLDRVSPPDDVAPLHRRFVAQLRDFGDRVDTAVASLDSGDPAKIIDAQQALLRSRRSIERQLVGTVRAINRELART